VSNADKALERANHAQEVARSGQTFPSTVAGFFQDTTNRARIDRLLPKDIGLDAKKLLQVAINCVRMEPKLAACNVESFVGALMGLASLGLIPGAFPGHAYLIPFGKEVTPIIDYKGYIHLGKRDGDVSDVFANVIYSNDDYEWGDCDPTTMRPSIKHRRATGDRGERIAVYAVTHFDSGDFRIDYMDAEEVEKRHAVSKAKNGDLWTKWTDNAWKKTVIREARKFWRLLPETDERLAVVDERISTQLSPATIAPEPGQPDPFAGQVIDSEATEDENPSDGMDTAAEPGIAKNTLQKLAIATKDIDEEHWRAYMREHYAVDSRKDLTDAQGQEMLAWAVFTKGTHNA
jgi:recombination protein RecT